MDTFGPVLVLLACAIFYLLPTVIAAVRKCQHSGTIFIINFIFGWTVLGWIAALIWAIAERPEAPKPLAQTNWQEPFYK